MVYRVRRIGLGSALRVGLLLGWLVALLPAAGAAALCVAAVQQVSTVFGQVAPYEISFLGQPVASLDFLELLGLSNTAANVSDLAGRGSGLFWTLALGLTLVGGLGAALTLVLVCLVYNLIAGVGGGLKVELAPAPRE